MRRVFPILLSFAITAGVNGFDLDSLLVQSVGGPEAYERIKNMTSFYAEGDLQLNGVPGTFVQIQAPPDLSYSELNLGAIAMIQGYDGSIGWTTDLAGNAEPMSDFETKELLRSSFIPSFSFLVDDWIPGGAEYRGTIQRYDRRLHEVAFYPLYGDPVLAHFDVESTRMTDYQAVQDEILANITLSEYEKVDGVWIPFYARLEAEGAPMLIEQRTTHAEFDRELPDGQFSMPSEVAYQTAFPADKSRVTIKIDYRAGNIKMRATLNGQKTGWFILDTGAEATVLDSEFASDLNLPEVGTLPAKGAAGYSEFSMVGLDSLRVGELTLYRTTVGVTDLEPLRIHGPGDTRFGGIIGYDFLSQFPMLIDYDQKRLTFYNRENFAAPDSGYVIPFKFYQRVPVITGEVLGIPGDMIVDLGNPFGLILHQPFVKEHNLEHRLDKVVKHDQKIGGVGGSIRASTAYVASFKMGDILLTSIRAILAEGDFGLVGSENLAGNIGNLVLENFRLLLDYPAKRIILYASDGQSKN